MIRSGKQEFDVEDVHDEADQERQEKRRPRVFGSIELSLCPI